MAINILALAIFRYINQKFTDFLKKILLFIFIFNNEKPQINIDLLGKEKFKFNLIRMSFNETLRINELIKT